MRHMIVLTLTIFSMSALKSQYLDTSDGMKFLEKHEIKHSISKWTIRYAIAIDDFMSRSIELNKCKQKILKLCERLADEPNCLYYEKFINTNEKHIKREFENIKSISKHSKRSLIYALAYNWIRKLFSGNMDQEIIDALQKIDRDTKDIVKHHITVTNSTMVINKKAFQGVNNLIKKLSNEVDLLADIQSDMLLKLHLSNVIQSSNLILLEFYHMLSCLGKIVNRDRTANILDIIGDDIFLMNLKNIETKLGRKQVLPVAVSNNTLFDTIQLSDVTIKVSSLHINIEVTIPILSDETYQHYQILSLPFRVNDSFFMYGSVAENIFVNWADNSYALVPNNELRLCKVINQSTLICPIHSSILFGIGCEMETIRFNDTKNCELKQVPNHNYVIRFDDKSFYIVPMVKTKVFIECNNGSKEELWVNSTLRINVENGCSFKTEDFEYFVEEEKIENVAIRFSKNFAYEIPADWDSKFKRFNNNTILIEEMDFNLENVTKQLLELYEQANEVPDRILVSDDKFGIIDVMILGLIAFLVIRAGLLLLKLRKK